MRWIWSLLVLAAMVLTPAAPAQQPARVVAVGDLHGDYDAWAAIARRAGLVDAKGRWAGGRTTLVQMGDVVDRGPDSLKIMRHLMRLQKEAVRKGGRVVALVGNHEAMNMTRDLRYVHPGEYAVFVTRNSERLRDRIYDLNRPAIEAAYRARDPKISAEAIRADWLKATPLGMLEHQAAWAADGEIGKWVLSNPAVARLGDSLFVHGGISAAYASLSVDDINRQVATALKAADQSPTSIINHPQGPLWYRGLVMRGEGDEATLAPIPAGAAAALTIDQEIELVLRSQGVKRIIVGHTPSKQGVVESAGGRLWRVDSGISRVYGGTPAYLEIVGDRVAAHVVPRPPGQPWSAP